MTYASEVLADSPLAYWRLGDASGTTMTDSSGNARHGIYAGSPGLGTVGLLTGDGDTAVTFDGVDDFGEVADAAWMDTGTTLTVEAWIKTTATGLRQIITRDDGTGTRSFQFLTNGASLQFVKIASGVVTSTVSTSINDGVRHHVVATYDGANIRLYKDGALVQTTAATGSLSSDDKLRIGLRATGAEFFSGVIDEAAYYGTALSAARVLAHYNAGITSPTATEGALAITLPKIQVAFTGAYEIGTDTSNQLEGFRLGGYVINEAAEPAPATPPAIWTPTRSDDMALYLPPPVIVDGRIVR